MLNVVFLGLYTEYYPQEFLILLAYLKSCQARSQ